MLDSDVLYDWEWLTLWLAVIDYDWEWLTLWLRVIDAMIDSDLLHDWQWLTQWLTACCSVWPRRQRAHQLWGASLDDEQSGREAEQDGSGRHDPHGWPWRRRRDQLPRSAPSTYCQPLPLALWQVWTIILTNTSSTDHYSNKYLKEVTHQDLYSWRIQQRLFCWRTKMQTHIFVFPTCQPHRKNNNTPTIGLLDETPL